MVQIMINFNNFSEEIDFVCGPYGCYSVNTALALPSSDPTNNLMCYSSDYTQTTPEENYASLLPQIYNNFRQAIFFAVPFIALYMDSQKFKEEISKFAGKYFSVKKKEIPSIAHSSNQQKLKSTVNKELQHEESEGFIEKFKDISGKSIDLGKDVGNLTLVSLNLTNSVYPVNSVTTLLQAKKIFSSLKKSRELYLKGNKKLDLSEQLLKLSSTAMKMALKGTKNFLTGKLLTQSFSTASSALGYLKSFYKKKDLNFLLAGILLLSGIFKLEDLIIKQFSPLEEKVA